MVGLCDLRAFCGPALSSSCVVFNERTGNVYENKRQGQNVEQPVSADLQVSTVAMPT